MSAKETDETPAKKPKASPLRRVFDTAERGVASRVEPLAQSGGFASLLGTYVAARRAVGVVGSATGGLLHLVKIPTTSDVGRLHQHLATVDSHIAELIRELDARPAAGGTSGDVTVAVDKEEQP